MTWFISHHHLVFIAINIFISGFFLKLVFVVYIWVYFNISMLFCNDAVQCLWNAISWCHLDFLSINNIWPIHKVLYQYKLTNNYKNYILMLYVKLIYLLSASAASSVRPPKRTWHWKNKIIMISCVITLHKYLNLLKTFCCVIMGVLFIEVHVICKQWNLRS